MGAVFTLNILMCMNLITEAKIQTFLFYFVLINSDDGVTSNDFNINTGPKGISTCID